MNMFKTIGIITGGAIVGVTSTMLVVNKKQAVIENMEHKIRDKADDIFLNISQKKSNTINSKDEDKHEEKEEDILIIKINQIDKILKEIKDIIELDNKLLSEEEDDEIMDLKNPK